MAKGKVENVYIQDGEVFKCDDIVTVKQVQQNPFTGRICSIDYKKISIDTSKKYKSWHRDVDTNSDAFIGLERAEGVE